MYDYVEKLMVSLRDGRKLIGVLRSWDQFGMSFLLTRISMQIGSQVMLNIK